MESQLGLRSITTNEARGGDGIPVELFQILKEHSVSAALNMSANLENSAMAYRTGKSLFPFQSQREAMPKIQTTAQLHSSHMLASNAQNSPSQVSTIHDL